MKLIKTFLIIIIFLTISLPTKEINLLVKKNNNNFFIENKGQWAKEVKYLTRIGGMNAWITEFGVVYDYYKIIQSYKPNELSKIPLYEKEKFGREHTSIKGHIVKSIFKNRANNQSYITQGKKETYFNYFIGNDKSRWASFVPLYEGVTVKEIYKGIDINYYFDKNLLRYDFIVKPGADISQINIEFEGTDDLIVTDKGELEIVTSLGNVKHKNIVAYQKDKTIECSFKKRDNNSIGFRAENYDRDKELIIDPLIYSTYIGGNRMESISSIALIERHASSAIIAGVTDSPDYPTTIGSYDTTFTGTADILVTRLNPSGSSLIYSTFIGGDVDEVSTSIAIDKNGNSYLTGWTHSSNFPTTTGSFDESENGGADVYVLKLNSKGSNISYSTLLGGSENDYGYGLALDLYGNVYFTGRTVSSDFPTTKGSYDESYNAPVDESFFGPDDIFVAKLNIDRNELIYSTYLGGNKSEWVYSLTVDFKGNAYVTGWTYSINFPTTSTAFDQNLDGDVDAFVTSLNSDGTNLIYSTFLGGSNDDYAYALTVDLQGNIFVTGKTESDDFPTTFGVYDDSLDSFEDIFITKINSIGTDIIYSTYLGGSFGQAGLSIAIDENENAYITGNSYSRDFPTTYDAISQTNNGGADVIVTVIDSKGSGLIYSTYIGGISSDAAYSIAVDKSNNIFIVGTTFPTQFIPNYPTTNGAYSESSNGLREGFVTKISYLITSVDDKNNTNILHKNMALEQNYPNPFNPETTISFQLSTLNFVTLKVFDILGREITTLVNEEKPAGTYKVNFDASGLPSGVYFFRLKTKNFVDTKKMVFLR